MKEKHAQTSFRWVETLKARGLGGAFSIFLDVIEPVAPIASQMMYVVQPISGAFGMNHVVRDLADALDTQDGIDALRDQLDS